MKTESMLKGLFALGFLLSLLTFIILSAFLILVHPELPASAEVSDKHLDVIFYPQSNYLYPGETSTFHFEITNKGYGTANKTDIKLKVSYYGNIVYERSEASIREYRKGKRVVITTEQKLPLVTPPGEYLMEFGFKLDNADERYAPTRLRYKVYVQPSFYQLLFAFLGVLIFGYSFFYFKKVEIATNSLISLLRKEYKHFTVGQRFLFIGICAIMITALLLMLGMESLANQVAIVAYYLLVMGIANNLLEYLKIEEEVRYVLSLCVLSALVFLPDNGIEDLIGKTLSAFTIAWAGFSFLELEKKHRSGVVKYLAILLVPWIIYNLLKNSMPYYGIGLLIALLLYLRER